MNPDVQRAAAARDAALARLRRATGVAVAGGAALLAAFTGLAAASTHARKLHRTRPQVQRRTQRPQAVTAPAPPLVGVPGAGSEGSQSGQSAQPPTAPAAPQQSYSPPVAVSGGS